MKISKIIIATLALTLVAGCSKKLPGDRISDNSMKTDNNYDYEYSYNNQNNAKNTIFFEYDSSSLTPQAKELLARHAQSQIQSNNEFIIEGHCDERGTREYNIALGERRANTAKNYLVQLGIDAKRLTVVSYGKERPLVIGDDQHSWSQNRRAVIVTR